MNWTINLSDILTFIVVAVTISYGYMKNRARNEARDEVLETKLEVYAVKLTAIEEHLRILNGSVSDLQKDRIKRLESKIYDAKSV